MNLSLLNPSRILSIGTALAIFGILGKTMSFWAEDFLTILPSTSLTLAIASVLILTSVLINKRSIKGLSLDIWTFGSFLAVVFLSDWLNRSYNLMQGPAIRGEIILFSILTFFVIKKDLLRYASWLPYIALSTVILCFLWRSGGHLLFMDDHTSFFYRLGMLKMNFPFIPFYDPQWNAGIDSRDYFATGALNVFFLFSPIIYAFDLHYSYNYIVIIILFIFTPFCTYLAARMENFPGYAPKICAVLSVCCSLIWYRWALQYGTVGFMTTIALIPLNLVMASRILSPQHALSAKECWFSIISFTLMLLWAPSGLVFIPAFFLALLSIRTLLQKKYVLKIALFLVIMNLPWMILFWSISNVSKLIKSPDNFHPNSTIDRQVLAQNEAQNIEVKVPKLKRLSLTRSIKVLRESAVSTNPLILFLALPGLLLMRKKTRQLIGITALWLLFLGTVCVPLNPRLELDRMLLILACILCVPTGLAIYTMLEQAAKERLRYKYLMASLAGGFLLSAVFSVCAVLLNRSLVQFAFASEQVDQMADAITKYNQGGRILYTGFVLHELSNGHLAPLALFTKVPLVASSHVHNMWKYTELVPEPYYDRNDEGKEEFFNLNNAGAIFAHEAHWKEYLRSRPEKYTKVWAAGKFELYTVNNFVSNYFLKGSGQLVQQDSNSVTIRATTPDVVIKFNYFPFLKSSACAISPHALDGDIQFIELKNCPLNTDIKIESGPFYKRLKLG